MFSPHPVRLAGKYSMVSSYTNKEVKKTLSPNDVFLGRRMARGFQFLAWPGMPHTDVAKGLLTANKEQRTMHAIFGRDNVPIDIAVDLDAPLPPGTSATEAKKKQNEVLERALGALDKRITEIGEKKQSMLVLQSAGNSNKVSFHLHARLDNACFRDYRSLHGFLAPVKTETPELDVQIYRDGGSLRLFNNFKENGKNPLEIVPHVSTISDPVEAMQASFCTRSFTKQEKEAVKILTFEPPAAFTTPSSGEVKQEAGEFLRTIPGDHEPVAQIKVAKKLLEEDIPAWHAENWHEWIRVFLAVRRLAIQISEHPLKPADVDAEEELLVSFIKFSRRCPSKFKGNAGIRRHWAQNTRLSDTKGKPLITLAKLKFSKRD